MLCDPSPSPREPQTQANVKGTTTSAGIWARLNQYSDVMLAVAVCAVIGMMIVPLPEVLLDLLFILNLIALGLGPLVVGFVSDLLMPVFGKESLRWSLMGTSLLNVWAGIHFMLAGSAYAREMKK